MPTTPDHEPIPEHHHHPLLRITVTACPDDHEALLLDVDLGAPLGTVSGAEVEAVLVTLLENGLGDGMDRQWRAMLSARN